MKRIFISVLTIFSFLFLVGCKDNNLVFDYDQNTFGVLNIKKEEVKILQLTDLHLTYGFDYLDRKTYKLIDGLIEKESPDLIIITGDLFMSVLDKRLMRQLINFFEDKEIPWSFVFGNHETEYIKKEKLVKYISGIKTKYLIFNKGPKLSDDYTFGYSNFKIRITNDFKDLVNLYMLDTKSNRTDGVKDAQSFYDYLSLEQVAWYNENVRNDLVGSLAFMHIPLEEYLNYEGEIGEKIWPQGKNTNFFQTIIDNNLKTKGVFVGHDHLNDFLFTYKDVYLAYGLSTGFNEYGIKEKGGRVIVLSDFLGTNFKIETYLVSEHEVFNYAK